MQFVFGVRDDIRNSVHFWSENKIVYAAGHNVIDYNIEERIQRFYPPMEGSTVISALTMSSKRNLVAFAESQRSRGAIVNIYDKNQRKRRCLISTNSNATNISSMAFSTDKDERYLLILYGAPATSLLYWCWNSPNHKGTLPLKHPVESSKCSFNPLDSTLCVLTGKNTFLLVQIEPTSDNVRESFSLKVLADKVNADAEHSRNYTSHCWTPDGVLVLGTDKGELLAVNSAGGLIGMARIHKRIDSLEQHQHGIALACEGPTVITMSFSKDNKEEMFKETSVHSLGDEGGRVTSLAANPVLDKMLVCITTGKQLLRLGVNRKPQELISNFHSKSVIGMDVCVRKPLVATCSEDNTIRVWNFAEKTLELKFKSPEISPLSLAFHPSGLLLAVGCPDKVYIMSVYLDTLKVAQEIPVKQFREVAFSNGGQYLAVSHSNLLQVFNFYTMEVVPNLTISPAKIQTIQWYEDDTGLVTSDLSNYVSFCELDAQLTSVLVNSKHAIAGVVKIPGSPAAFVACSDLTVKEIADGTVNKKLELTGNPGQLAITRNKKLFFVGLAEATSPGVLKCFKYPLSSNESIEIQAHARKIQKMKVSFNDKYLFTAGADGCVIVYELSDRDRIRDVKAPALKYSDEILTDRQQINDIQQRLEEAIGNTKEFAVNKTSEQDSIMAGLTQEAESFMLRIKQKRVEYEEAKVRNEGTLSVLNAEHDSKLKKTVQAKVGELDLSKRKHLEKHAKKSTDYNKKSLELESLLREQEAARVRLFQENANAIAKQREINSQAEEAAMAELSQRAKELESKLENQKEIISQILKDNDTELNMMSKEYNTQLQKKNEQVVKLRGEHQVNTNKVEDFNRKSEELVRDIKELKESLNKARAEERVLENQIIGLNAILDEKSREIAKLEQEIYQHKKEAQKLEKFKFVLDYKIKELKREMNPREQQIESLREKTTQMDKKLKKFNKLNVFLRCRFKELKDTQQSLQEEITNNREKLRKNTIHVKECLDALDYCVRFINLPEKLREAVFEKLEPYKKESEQATKLPSAISHEFKTQEEFMANSVKTLERELEASKKIRKNSNKLVRNQNKVLIMEIQRLRGLIEGAGKSGSSLSARTHLQTARGNYRSSSEFKDAEEEAVRSVDDNKQALKSVREKIEKAKRENAELRSARLVPI